VGKPSVIELKVTVVVVLSTISIVVECEVEEVEFPVTCGELA
jgi:hypothetical protein